LGAAAAARSAEKFAKDIAKDIFETRIEIESAGKRTVVTESRMTVLIVLCSLVRVRKYLVRLRNQLKGFFRLFVSGVPIGMMLKRKFSVRLLDLILAGIATDSQQLIVIFFAVQAPPRF
jgi:hypothetical protein